MAPSNALDDAGREISLLSRELLDYWPSLVAPQDFYQAKMKYEPEIFAQTSTKVHEAWAEAMSVEEFNLGIDEMKCFMNLVLKIAFNHLHYDQFNPVAQQMYESFFPLKQAVGPASNK